MKHTLTFKASLLALFMLGSGQPANAQGLPYDPAGPIRGLLDYTNQAISEATKPLDMSWVVPQLGEHNKQGRLIHAWRGGPVLKAQGNTYNNVDGQVFRNEYHEDDGSLKLTKGQSLWEFYEDGTFLHVEVQTRGLIEMRARSGSPGWQVFRGKYEVKEDGIYFEGSYRGFAYGYPFESGSIAGVLFQSDKGQIEVRARQVEQIQSAFSNPYGRHSATSMYTKEYTLVVQRATR